MTTAYTPILQLALPVTGELDGTWGTVVNDNITSMIEQAIAGLATINTWTTASHTLTTADGTTDEARCAVLECSGAPGAAATVICPARTKLFVIKNSVTGGYAVTLKTSAGTGISVPNGSTALLYCDGTNVVSGATYMATLVTTSITDSGLTSGRVTYAGAGGLLQDAAALTFDGTTLSSTKFAGALDGTVGATTPTTVVATQVDITAQGDLRLQDTTGGQYVALQAPGTVAASYTLTLPVDDGTAGQALVTDGSGVLSWSTAASGDVYGPASATDNAVARFDGTTGKIIQNSVVTIADTTGNMAGVGTLSSGAITSSALTSGRVPYAGTAGLIQDSANLTFDGTTLTNTGNTIIADNSANAALRITQVGAGNALLVEDSANPDATPFVVNADGRVVSGKLTPSTNVAGGTPQLQVHSTVASGIWSSGTSFNWSASNQGAGFNLAKSRSGTVGTQTVVQSGDGIGIVGFYGDDGTNFISAAQITGEVDGTPGTNDMPGRLVFSTTADGASTPTERMRITNDGRINIGTASNTSFSVVNAKSITGATTQIGYGLSATIASDVTTLVAGYRSLLSTQAAAFTLPNLYHYEAVQGTFGATSAVTNQYGFVAGSSLTGATNNYGFFSNIASGTGRFNFYANGTAANVFVGTTSIGGVVGSESLRVTPIASAVNYIEAQGQITTGGPSLIATGSDTNVPLLLKTKGAGSFNFYTSGATLQFLVGHVASAVNYLQVSGAATGGNVSIAANGTDTNIGTNYVAKGTGQHFFYSNSSPQFLVSNTASAVNYLQVAGGATGGGPTITTQGTDTNIAMFFSAKGAGQYFFSSNSSTQFNISNTASAVNYLRVAGAIATAAPALSAQGSDTNIDLVLTPKGTGVLAFGTYTAGVVAQAGYITIKDAGGTTRRLLVG